VSVRSLTLLFEINAENSSAIVEVVSVEKLRRVSCSNINKFEKMQWEMKLR
jgi:hypothetical protein